MMVQTVLKMYGQLLLLRAGVVLLLVRGTVLTEAVQGCKHEQRGFVGTIFSQNYPQNYNNSLKCEWIIKSKPSTKVQLRLTDFQLEKNPKCRYDFLEVYDGISSSAKRIGRYCGTTYPDLITSTSNDLYLYFQTDRADTYRGFEATWLAVSDYGKKEGRKLYKRSKLLGKEVENDSCGKVFTAKTGELTSPNYPNQYPSDSTCYWTIKSDAFHEIILTFEDFKMEQHSDCRYDYLLIKDGEGSGARVIGKYCGQKYPSVVRAKTQALRLELISDSTTQRKGFKAKWKLERKESVSPSDCGGKIKGKNGVVASPRYPNSGASPYICIWYITVPEPGRVKFEFTDVNIISRRGCSKGYVQLNDGKTRKGPSLGVFCGTGVPKPIFTTANTLRIGFFSDGSGFSKGFSGKWSTVYGDVLTPTPKIEETACHKVFYEQSGQITRLTALTNCSWTIKVPSNKDIFISVGDLNMLPDDDCRREEVTVRNGVDDGGYLLMRMCGQLRPNPIRSSANEIIIRHTVAKSLSHTKMNIIWKTVEEDYPYNALDEVTCGISSIPQSVNNGDKGALPWTIGIMGLFNRAHCGGAILSADWIITSAHCFERLPWTMLWSVRAGEYDLRKSEGTEQNRNIREIIIHPQYNPITYDNDIALLRLDQPLTLTRKVRSVCLPPADMDIPAGKVCSVAGWGTSRYLSQRPSGPLEHIFPKIISKDKCNRSYNGKITNNMICAGGNGLDSCQGDGGSPLSCVDNAGRYYVVGLSSWGNGCALPGKYGVYTDVRGKIQWIKDTVTGREKK